MEMVVDEVVVEGKDQVAQVVRAAQWVGWAGWEELALLDLTATAPGTVPTVVEAAMVLEAVADKEVEGGAGAAVEWVELAEWAVPGQRDLTATALGTDLVVATETGEEMGTGAVVVVETEAVEVEAVVGELVV